MMPTLPFVDQAHPIVRRRWARFIERLMPWFDPATERKRDARTETIRLRSIGARIRTEHVLAQYREVDRRR